MADLDIDHLTAAQIEALQSRLAEQLAAKRASEKAELVAEIIQLVDARGYDPQEILAMLSRKVASSTAAYVNPNDPTEVWSGQGRRPKWLKDLLDSGHTLDEFRSSQP